MNRGSGSSIVRARRWAAAKLLAVLDYPGRNGCIVFEAGVPGYRDQLCGQITKIVPRAFMEPGDCVQIDFWDHTSIMIPLRPETYRVAEAVILKDDKDKRWAVW